MEPIKNYFDITLNKDKLIYKSEVKDILIEFTRKFKHDHELPADLSEAIGYEELKTEGWYVELLLTPDECLRIVSEDTWIELPPASNCDMEPEVRAIYRSWIENPISDLARSSNWHVIDWYVSDTIERRLDGYECDGSRVRPFTASQIFYYEKTGKDLSSFTVYTRGLYIRFHDCSGIIDVIPKDTDDEIYLKVKTDKLINIVDLMVRSTKSPSKRYRETRMEYINRTLNVLGIDDYEVLEDTITEFALAEERASNIKLKLDRSANISARIIASRYFDHFKDYDFNNDWNDVVRLLSPSGCTISVVQKSKLNIIDRLFRDHPTLEDSLKFAETQDQGEFTFSAEGYLYTTHIKRK